MYYPYFRGKQYDLIAIRECAELMAENKFIPIIEPVKESFSALTRTIQALQQSKCQAILIANPQNGDHSTDASSIIQLLKDNPGDNSNIKVGIMLSRDTTIPVALEILQEFKSRQITFIHAGFSDPAGLVKEINNEQNEYEHVFFDDFCGKLYRKHFKNTTRILIKDGFEKRANRAHPEVEFFSDLHVTYKEDNMNGFGDFLTVGSDYSEGGGPAYTVAIHITFIDPDNEDTMYIHHFKSDRNDTPTDPGGKFAEALKKLIQEIEHPNTKIIITPAINEFKALHASGHFPGLGSVKKLSMKHHIQTLADFFDREH